MIGILIKNRLSALFGALVSRGRGGEVKSAPIWKKILVGLLIVALVGYFVFAITMMAISFAAILIPFGGDWLYYALIMLASLTVTFIMSIFETKSELFECKDNELLLSMPIKPADILISRILVVLIYNYAIDAVFMIPAIVVYGVYSLNVLGIIGGILAYLFIPLIGVSLASAVGFLVALISRHFKNKTAFTMVFAISFLVLYFWGYSYLVDGATEFFVYISGMLDSFKSEVPILDFIGSVALLDPLPLAIFVSLTAVLALVAFFVISHNYISIITSNSRGPRVQYKEKKLSNSGILGAIVKKEFRRFTSSSTYMLNGGLGFIMPLVLSVLAFVNAGDLRGFFVSTLDFLIPFVAIAAVFSSSLGFMSACTLSLEGHSFWIIKSMPITSRAIVLGKTLPQIIISLPISVISGICISIAMGISPIYCIFIVLIGMFSSVAFAFLGIIFNILFPRFDFTSEAHVVKQSMASGLSLFSQMAISLLLVPLVIWFITLELSPIFTLSVMLGIMVALSAAFAAIALIPCATKIDKMNV